MRKWYFACLCVWEKTDLFLSMLMTLRTVTQNQGKSSHLAELEALAGGVCVGPDRTPLWRGAHITLQLRVLPVGSAWSQGFSAQINHIGLDLETVGFGCIYTSCSVLRGVHGKC